MSQIQVTANYNRFRPWDYLQVELLKANAFLLPLRVFIGLGWLRAGAEKMLDPRWWSGDKLAEFLAIQMGNDAVYFPFYQTLISQLFEPNVLILSFLVLVGELAAGLAILTGTLTIPALLGALFMNVNFVLAGEVNPSAFYIVIQYALLSANVGMILGGDSLLAARAKNGAIIHRTSLPSQRLLMASAIFCGIGAMFAIPYIRDFGPHSVDDPAMLLFILLMLGTMLSCIHLVRKGT